MKKTGPEKDTPEKLCPEMIAAFRKTRDECFAEYRETVSRNPWADRRRMLKARPEDFRAVYVPCAMFDASVAGELPVYGKLQANTGDATVVSSFRTDVRLSYRYENALFSRAPGIGTRKIRVNPEDLAVYAPGSTGDAEILPAALSPEGLAFSVREAVAGNARSRAVQELNDRYHDIRYTGPNEAYMQGITSMEYKGDALVPAWIMEHGKGKRKKYTVMNGVTGELWTVPGLNPWRFLLASAYTALLLAGLLFLLFVCVWKMESPWIPALAAALPAGLLVSFLRGKRKLSAEEPGGVRIRPERKGVKIIRHQLTKSRKIRSDDD